MTLAEFCIVDVEAMWDGLTHERQAAIGAAALAWELARRAGGENGPVAEEEGWRWARGIASDIGWNLSDAVSDAFPGLARPSP